VSLRSPPKNPIGLRESVRRILPTVDRLLARAPASASLNVCVNDNSGRWHDGPTEPIDRARGGPVVYSALDANVRHIEVAIRQTPSTRPTRP